MLPLDRLLHVEYCQLSSPLHFLLSLLLVESVLVVMSKGAPSACRLHIHVQGRGRSQADRDRRIRRKTLLRLGPDVVRLYTPPLGSHREGK
jgi:hypothetical protein